MPRGVLKENLPEKLCVTCNRPFTWRKKWERCWDEVTTCSKSCNAKRREAKTLQRQREGDEPDDVTAVVGALTDMALTTRGNDDGKDRIPFDELVDALDDVGDDDDNDNDGGDDTNSGGEKPTNEYPVGSREWRKVQRKAAKAQQRLTRQEGAGEDAGRKSCDLCAKRVDLLIRCTTDSTKQWRMVCGRCWRDVSGGVPDGDAAHLHYTYGGLWKNRSRGAS